jgi:plastocyanin
MIPFSSVVVLLVIGFVIGSLAVGLAAGATETRLLANSGKSAKVVIVQGAGSRGNPGGYFSPDNYTIKVGQTVTWANGDGTIHP